MKIELYFCLVVFCGAAKGFTEMLVDLGQNVTLPCEVGVKDVHWFLMKPSEPPVFILHTYSSRALKAVYSNLTFNKTFSVQYNSSLFIHNISTNELGVYYCSQTPTGSPPDISRGIRLYTRTHSAENQTSKANQNQTRIDKSDKCGEVWRSLFITLGILNCLVLIMVTAFLCHKISTNHQARPPDPGIRPSQYNNNPIYDDVPYTPPNGCIRMNILNSTYALVQPVNPVILTDP